MKFEGFLGAVSKDIWFSKCSVFEKTEHRANFNYLYLSSRAEFAEGIEDFFVVLSMIFVTAKFQDDWTLENESTEPPKQQLELSVSAKNGFEDI